MRPRILLVTLALLAVDTGARAETTTTDTVGAETTPAIDPAAAKDLTRSLAETARKKVAGMSFEAFAAAVPYLEETGKYYVDGDTPIRNIKLLREFWEQNIRFAPVPPEGSSLEFSVATVGGLDAVWNGAERLNLAYCVSPAFGARYPEMVESLAAAAAAWESAADVDFIHVMAADATCQPGRADLVFDVRPVNAGGTFLAAAFFPNDPAPARSLVVDPSAFAISATRQRDGMTLTGILRHELGHVLGGRHEHTRPEAGTCFEDADWRPVTRYDAFSVMHYPQCNGLADWSLTLTSLDRQGIACLYGPAAGTAFDPAICSPESATGQPRARVVDRIDATPLATGAFRMVTTASPQPGTPVVITMTGTGDPDLYVKIDGPPLLSNFDCRPMETGADEQCDFLMPPGTQSVFVAVHGFAEASYALTIEYTPQSVTAEEEP
ncbi:MAG: matrixin family metalloprotease [Pseudomonadota bacterium]